MGQNYKMELADSLPIKDSSRNLGKSGEKVDGKPKREVEQYVGNRDKDVISEFERLREKGKKTKVIHRLWRWIGGALKNVHEHKK